MFTVFFLKWVVIASVLLCALGSILLVWFLRRDQQDQQIW